MNAVLSPIVSEFVSNAAATSYDPWFCAKVKVALDDPRPSMPHDEAVARMDKMLAEKRNARAVVNWQPHQQNSHIVKIPHAR